MNSVPVCDLATRDRIPQSCSVARLCGDSGGHESRRNDSNATSGRG
ncbi:MAG: hypothetical protein MRJ65_13895 [Candidatus Brocadiaceae bacterium]|nr:hypothetical protein [Candidatus Brocadiaceae bacterium]